MASLQVPDPAKDLIEEIKYRVRLIMGELGPDETVVTHLVVGSRWLEVWKARPSTRR